MKYNIKINNKRDWELMWTYFSVRRYLWTSNPKRQKCEYPYYVIKDSTNKWLTYTRIDYGYEQYAPYKQHLRKLKLKKIW